VQQPGGAGHFGVGQRGTVLAADVAHGRVGVACHRREDQRRYAAVRNPEKFMEALFAITFAGH
jgi:hypothetical protein